MRAKLLTFQHEMVELDQFQQLVNDAKDALGVGSTIIRSMPTPLTAFFEIEPLSHPVPWP